MKSVSVLPPGIGGRYLMDGRLYEVINITSELISFRDAHGTRPLFLTPDALDDLSLKKQIVLAESPPIERSAAVRFVNSTDPDVILAKDHHFYVMAIRNTYQGALPREACVEKLKALALERGDTKAPSYTTLWRWTALCKQGNWSPWSLLKQKSDRPRGKQTPEAVRSVMLRYINEAYLNEQKNSISIVHSWITGQITQDNIVRRSTNARLLPVPSLSTVRREIKRLCHYQTDKARLGGKAAADNNKFGPAWDEPEYLLEQGEIDCQTPCDIMLVDGDGELLGKMAHLQAIIEVKSGKIIGHDLSLMPPCAGKTLKCLRMSLLAVPGEEFERGKLVTLAGDRGTENNNINVKTATHTLGIQLLLPPPGMPDGRPHIESFLATVITFIHSLPGTTFSSPKACGRYDSAAHACLTIEQLQAKFEDWLENVYHNHPLKRGRTNLSPNARWAKAMSQQLAPVKYSEEDLNAALRSTKHCRINKGVVGFDHMQWSSPGLAEIEHDFKPRQKAIVLYDIADLGQVWVHHPDRPLIVVPADARDRRYQTGLSLYEHRLVMDALAAEEAGFSRDGLCLALLRIRQDILQIEKEYHLRKKTKAQNQRKAAKKAAKTSNKAPPALATVQSVTSPPLLLPGASIKSVYIEGH